MNKEIFFVKLLTKCTSEEKRYVRLSIDPTNRLLAKNMNLSLSFRCENKIATISIVLVLV